MLKYTRRSTRHINPTNRALTLLACTNIPTWGWRYNKPCPRKTQCTLPVTPLPAKFLRLLPDAPFADIKGTRSGTVLIKSLELLFITAVPNTKLSTLKSESISQMLSLPLPDGIVKCSTRTSPVASFVCLLLRPGPGCTAHSGATKAHDWMVGLLGPLFRTAGHTVRTQHGVTASAGQRRGDVEIRSYLQDAAGRRSLVFDLSITHDRFGSSEPIMYIRRRQARQHPGWLHPLPTGALQASYPAFSTSTRRLTSQIKTSSSSSMSIGRSATPS
jgi:hypothetical protein